MLKEALATMRNGNITNIPHTADNVKRFFDIYGAQVPGIRGRTMNKKARASTMEDRGARPQLTSQEMTADVMYVAGHKSLVSVSKLLGLTLIQPVGSLSRETLGKAL
jgi:hypothetical protein